MDDGINDFYRGDLKTYKFSFGQGVDITNYKIFLTLKANEDDPDGSAVMQVSSVAGDHPLDQVNNGIMYLVVKSTDTASVTPAKYFYGFQRVILGSNPLNVKTLLTGKVKILTDITIITA